MPRKADLNYAFRLPPEKAIKYFRSKGYTLSWDWYDTLKEAHARAFTVAHVARMDVLQDIRGMVDKSISEGLTFNEFRKQLEPKLKTKGWWGWKETINEETGEITKHLEGSPHRLKTIYRMNMTSAFNAGREAHFQENKKYRPYGMYVAVMDPRTRESHAELNGSVYPLDDPFWDAFTPPIDWNCRCRKRALSDRAIERKGLKVQSSEGRLEKRDKIISPVTGEVRKTTYLKTDGGWISTGPGFDYNPWKAAFQPDLEKYDPDIARKYIEGVITGPDFERFFKGNIQGMFPVAVLDETIQSNIGSKIRVVQISGETIANHKKHNVSLNVYQKLQDMIQKAPLIIKDDVGHFQFFPIIDGKFYRVIIKTTENDELLVTTFHRSNTRQINKAILNGKIIKNVQ